MLGIGAALLVGGWGAIRYADQAHRIFGTAANYNVRVWNHWVEDNRPVFVGGVLSMAVGAGLIGFAVLRPTKREDE